MGTLIEITDDNEIFIRETGLVKQDKPISDEDLFNILLQSCDHNVVQTPILPKGCILYEKRPGNREFFVMECEKGNWDFEYHGTVYKNVGVPKHLFFVEICDKKKIVESKLVAVKDYFVVPDTVLYRWPFSNIFFSNGICWGTTILPEITEPYQLSCIPRLFFNQGNTDCNYQGSNKSGLDYRQLLEELQGKEFNDKFLVKTKEKFKDFITNKGEDLNDEQGTTGQPS